MKENTAEIYGLLKQTVEKIASRKMRTPRDFEYLSMCIFDATHILISPTTLKRFWGYLDNGKDYQPRRFTLDLLSLYVGYKDWEAYSSFSSSNTCVNSDYVKSPCIYATSLSRGETIKLLWDPDRCVSAKYMGEDVFEVIESINSKVQVGDRFCCGVFFENEALYLSRLTRGEEVLGAYICGKENGIKYLLQPTNGADK